MNFPYWILALPLIHLVLLGIRTRFRDNVKEGDVIGVDLGTTIQNFKVVKRTGDVVIVQIKDTLKDVKIEQVYMPDYSEDVKS